jgi:gliding motility-associated-like protein
MKHKIKHFRLFFLLLSQTLLHPIVSQQFPNPVTLSTGQGPVGAADPLWVVSPWYTNNPPNPIGLTYTPALINNNCAPGAWVDPASLPPPVNNGKWITGNDASCAQNTNSGYRYFRLTMDLPADCNGQSIAGMNNYTLYLTGYVDNEISNVFVNGTATGISGGNFAPGGQLNMTLNGPWIGGINYIDIMVYNFPSSGANPYGLLLVADGSATASIDSDGDGISDLNDQCVCEPGTLPNGCNAALTGDLDICLGQSTTLTVATSGSVIWSNGTSGNSITVAPTQTTTYSATITQISGAIDNVSGTVTVHPVFTSTINEMICEGENYTFSGNTYSASGSYQIPLQTIHGCDSIITLNLLVQPNYEFNENLSICPGSNTIYQGTTLNNPGTYSFDYQTQFGCDSTYNLNLSFYPTPTTNLPVTSCDTYSWIVSGETYNTSGNYPAILSTSNGCDSTVILNLTIFQTPNAPELSANFPKCPGDEFNLSASESPYPITWTGPLNFNSNQFNVNFPISFEQTGTYSATLNNNGCISPESSIVAAIEYDKTFDDVPFPNTITPNNDNINDELLLAEYAMTCLPFELQIFNRWGILVYQGTETSAPFSGKSNNGNNLTDGVYFYKFTVEGKTKSGFIHLMR